MQWSLLSIDRRSPIPLYYQLAEAIKEGIRTGDLQPGDQLPSERDLSEYVAVSRMTARHAIAHLVTEGVVMAQHGRGTFVAEPKMTYDVFNLVGFTEETMRSGGVVVSRVLEQAVGTPTPRVAAELNLAPDATVTRIVRLRSTSDMPLLLETSYVPTDVCPGLQLHDLTAQSLYTLLEQHYGLRLAYAQQTLEATTANDYESALFGIPAGMAMLLVEGVTFLEHGGVVEYFKAVYRADRVKFAFASQRRAIEKRLAMPQVDVLLR